LTDGALSFDRFADLPAVYVMIFYTAACIEEGDCEPDNGSPPQIQLGDGMVNGDNPTDAVALFCKQILKSTSSSAEAVFDYSIRYNPDRIAQQDLAICLSTATVNVLLEELANCPLLAVEGEGETPSERRRRLLQWQNLLPAASSGSSIAYELTSANPDDRRRGLQDEEGDGSSSLGSVATPDESSCKYAIESTVDRLTELRTWIANLIWTTTSTLTRFVCWSHFCIASTFFLCPILVFLLSSL
jgi:hypothetical protein